MTVLLEYPVFYRLPHSLAVWIYELMRDLDYEARFPSDVKFGIRCDERYNNALAFITLLD